MNKRAKSFPGTVEAIVVAGAIVAIGVIVANVGSSLKARDLVSASASASALALMPAPAPAPAITRPDEPSPAESAQAQARALSELDREAPELRLESLRARFKTELAHYDKSLKEYERLERLVARRILKGREPSSDRELARLNESLKARLASLRAQSQRVDRAAARFNRRLIAAANTHFDKKD